MVFLSANCPILWHFFREVVTRSRWIGCETHSAPFQDTVHSDWEEVLWYLVS